MGQHQTDILNQPAGNIAKIMEAAVVRRFAAGLTITRCDEPAMHLFLIETGSVNFSRTTPEGREVLLRRLSAGEAFRLGTLLDTPIGYIGTAETAERTEVYTWEHEWVCRCAGEHPTLAQKALRIALEYIRLYSVRHLALVSDSAKDRVSRTLLRLGVRIQPAGWSSLPVHRTRFRGCRLDTHPETHPSR